MKYLFLLAILALWYMLFPYQSIIPAWHPQEMTQQERQYATAKMRYHGITSYRTDPVTGAQWFAREGKRCRL